MTTTKRPDGGELRCRTVEMSLGIRLAITWLHSRASMMNDPHAKAVLNSAAFNLGVDLARTPTNESPAPQATVDVTGLSNAEIADIESHVRGKRDAGDTYEYELGSGWRCFHCGEMFRTLGGAELHFGKPKSAPACTAAPATLIEQSDSEKT